MYYKSTCFQIATSQYKFHSKCVMMIGVAGKRTYDEGCAAAHALDLVGERWALLVVRELLLGPKRFTDLEAGLGQISPNVLAQRLRDLEALDVLRRHKLPPPAASQVYELTEWGMELEPVIMALGRWGSRSTEMPFGAPTSINSLIIALRTMFDPQAAKGLSASFELQLGDECFSARASEGQLELARGRPDQPDVVIASDTDTLKRLVFGGQPVAEAVRTGKLSISGNGVLAERFFELFKLPEPVMSDGHPRGFNLSRAGGSV